MRDGVTLLADHYQPDIDRPLGTILVRGPYGRALPFSFIYAQIYAARGYHVVFQSVRGTFGSGGDFVPMINEADDAADTVAWLREQPWFTGTFATIGLSYLGYTQWARLSDPPPELSAAVITVAPHDFHTSSWGTGSFALNDFLGWSDMIANQDAPSWSRVAFHFRGPARLSGAVNGVPVGAAGRALLGSGSPWYESWIEHPDVDDPFWDPMRMTEALDRCSVPVLLLSGWQDIFLDQSIAQFHHLHRRGVETALTIGPWSHADMVTKGAGLTAAETLGWLGRHLAELPTAPRADAVRIYVTGRHRPGWVELPDWPPAARDTVWYPRADGTLRLAPEDGASVFRYDPAHPTPTIGGRLLNQQSGYRDDTALAERSDVLAFTSEPLATELGVFGNPAVELNYRCDNPYFDVFVRISEVDVRGRSRNVTDGFRRFEQAPGGDSARGGVIRLELDAIAHRFSAGSRVRLLVAGGSHPRFARNLGTGEPVISGRRMVPSTHTLRHGGDSRLILPASEFTQ